MLVIWVTLFLTRLFLKFTSADYEYFSRDVTQKFVDK